MSHSPLRCSALIGLHFLLYNISHMHTHSDILMKYGTQLWDQYFELEEPGIEPTTS